MLLLPLLHLLLLLLRLSLLRLICLLVVFIEVLLRLLLLRREVRTGMRHRRNGKRQGECEKQSGNRESFHSFTTKLALNELYR